MRAMLIGCSLAVSIIVMIVGGRVQGQEIIDGQYLGQECPGMSPERFMPGVISTDDHFEFILTISQSFNMG